MSNRNFENLSIVSLRGGHANDVSAAAIMAGLTDPEDKSKLTGATTTGDDTARSHQMSQLEMYRRFQFPAIGDMVSAMYGMIAPWDLDTHPVQDALRELQHEETFEGIPRVPYAYRLFYDSLANGCRGDYRAVQTKIEKIYGLKFHGWVVPATERKTTLIGITKNRNEIIGEGNFDNYHNRRDPIVSVKFADIVKPHPYAEERIKAAKIVTIGPGSIAGSLDPALKPFGHLLTREKKVVFVGNFFGHPGEKFHGFKDLQKWFGPLIPGRDPFIDVLIASQMTRKQFETEYPLIAARYGKAKWIGDYPDAPDRQRNGDRRITVMRREHLHRVDEKQAMRHNSEELAQALQELVRENFYLYSRVPVLAENGYGAQAY